MSKPARPPKCPKSKTGPRGLALSIGINGPSTKVYGNTYEKLKSAENDARKMSDLARKKCFVSRHLLGRRATRDRVMLELKRAATSLKAGDIFLLTYAGHGSEIDPDWFKKNGIPLPPSVKPDEYIQTWVLWDMELLDKELRKIWTLFEEGVRILAVFDCCHSQTIVSPPLPPALRKPVRARERMRRFRTLLGYPQETALQNGKEHYTKVLEDAMPDEDARTSTKARLLSLAACQDDQLAVDGNSVGLFTQALLKALRDKKSPPKDYTTLINELQQAFLGRLDTNQTPGMLLYPDANNFQAEQPFTITPAG